MAFSTTNSIVLTGTIVTVGRWAEGKSLSVKVVTGAVFVAIGLAAMGEIAPQVAQPFGILILVMALWLYFPAIAKKAGIIK